MLGLAFTTHLLAETCDTNPGLCTTSQLCDKSTDVVLSQKYWVSDETDPHVKIARKFGLNCGALDALSACQINANKCTVLELCKIATVSNGKIVSWNLDFENHVKLAKSFGLSCEVTKGTTSVVSPQVDDLKVCDKNPAACVSSMLCEKAILGRPDVFNRQLTSYAKFFEEAKRRGLDCDALAAKPSTTGGVSSLKNQVVAAETATSSEELGNLFDKADFNKLRLSSRKQLQYGLKKLGYYKSSIDGLYGSKTQKAVRDYAKNKDIVEGYPDSVLVALITEAGAGTSVANHSNKTAHYTSNKYEDYDIFPFYEIACRSVFQAPWAGFKDLDKIKTFLSSPDNKCRNLGFKSSRYSLYDLPEAGVRIDLDNDGIRDLLVFLYGFQPKAPLKMVAFKFRSDKYQNNKSPILRAFKADEIFASGEYPTIQNARYISVADFNSDGEPDIVIADGGYDTEPMTAHFSKILLSSPEGFVERNISPKRKRHGAAAGDVNGDGFIDILFGISARQPSGKWESGKVGKFIPLYERWESQLSERK